VSKSDLVDITVIIIHQTDKAVLVDFGGKEHVWLPHSQVEVARSPNGKSHIVTLPEWLANEKGML